MIQLDLRFFESNDLTSRQREMELVKDSHNIKELIEKVPIRFRGFHCTRS